MTRFITPKGTSVYVSYIDDCDENAGGFYCEVERDCGTNDEINIVYYDNFVIHKEDIEGLEGEDLEDKLQELTKEYLKGVEY